jgi:urease accessory protein UreF
MGAREEAQTCEVADDVAREVAAMQFAGGRSIVQVAAEWERDPQWVEEAVREALLERIPQRSGGLMVSRAETRAANSEALAAACEVQAELDWGTG